MQIQRQETGEEGTYFIQIQGEEAARIEFRLRSDRLIIVHTIVNPGFEGKGLAKTLIENAISDARTGKYAIVPVCQFARKYFERHPEAADVL